VHVISRGRDTHPAQRGIKILPGTTARCGRRAGGAVGIVSAVRGVTEIELRAASEIWAGVFHARHYSP